MRWVTRLSPTRRIRRDERGVTVAFLALLVTVIVIIAGLVVDVGALQAERRELQNGADAAALALAQECAKGAALAACYADEMAEAVGLAGANANDSQSSVDSIVHGFHPVTGAHTVTVDTSTSSASGTILPYSFAQVFTGNDGQTVRATATAAWGPLAEGVVPALAMSYCDWWILTLGGTDYTLDPFFQSDYRAGISDCAGEPGYPAGVETRGGFTWLAGSNTACEVEVAVGQTYTAFDDPGFDPPIACNLMEFLNRPDLLVGIYDLRDDSFSPPRFRIGGLAAFEITRYQFLPGQRHDQDGRACPPGLGPANHCIDGHFRELDNVPGLPGGAGGDFGVRAVSLVA